MDPKAFLAKMNFTPKAIVREVVQPVLSQGAPAATVVNHRPEPAGAAPKLPALQVNHMPDPLYAEETSPSAVDGISTFEMTLMLKNTARAHHKKHPGGQTSQQSTHCVCGLPGGGPAGSDACVKLRSVLATLHAFDAEITRWQYAESQPDYASSETTDGLPGPQPESPASD